MSGPHDQSRRMKTGTRLQAHDCRHKAAGAIGDMAACYQLTKTPRAAF